MTILDTLLPYQKDFLLAKQKRKFWLAGRQIGKTHAVAALLVFKALSIKNGLSLCISTGARAASEIIRKCELFARAVKLLSKGKLDYTVSYDSVKFNNGSRVLSLPGSTDGANLRGWSAQCVDKKTLVRLKLKSSSVIYNIEIGELYEILHAVQDYESFEREVLHRATFN